MKQAMDKYGELDDGLYHFVAAAIYHNLHGINQLLDAPCPIQTILVHSYIGWI